MNALKQNPFWLAIGLAGIVLVALFAVMVFPLFGAQTTARKNNANHLKALKSLPVPGQGDIKNWSDYRKSLVDAYGKIAAHYTQSDKHLERWFDGLPDPPPRGDFTGRYHDEITKLEAAVVEEKQGRKTIIGDPGDEKKSPGFNWEEPTPDDYGRMQADEVARVLKELQKRYWARQRVANIIINGTAKVTRVVDFRFFKRLSTAIQNAKWDTVLAGADAVQYLGADAARGFTEFDLPNELGRTMTFGVALELPYSEVPKVIGELLNAGSEKSASERMLVNVIGTHVTIKSQNPLEENVVYERNKKDQFEKAVAEKRKAVQPKDVILTVTCQIIDFDASKIKSFAQ